VRHAIIRDNALTLWARGGLPFQCVTRVLLFGIRAKIPPLQWASSHLVKGPGSEGEDSPAHRASSSRPPCR